MLLLMSLMYLSTYKRHGFISGGKLGDFLVKGQDALFLIYGTMICAFSIILFSTFLTIQTISGKDKPIPPENVICPNCKKIFKGDDVPNLICSICGTTLEDLKGFYKRHPD